MSLNHFCDLLFHRNHYVMKQSNKIETNPGAKLEYNLIVGSDRNARLVRDRERWGQVLCSTLTFEAVTP